MTPPLCFVLMPFGKKPDGAGFRRAVERFNGDT
jgi:hypothetical protein